MNIDDLIKKYNLQKDDCWLLERSGKKMWIITHDACERIAIQEKIILKEIEVINSERDFARFLVTMQKEEISIKTIGEASKENCKSNYYGCMAEKRGIDRAILKLIEAYQYGIYSDVEADDFKKQNDYQEKKKNAKIINDQAKEDMRKEIIELAKSVASKLDAQKVSYYDHLESNPNLLFTMDQYEDHKKRLLALKD